MTWEGCLTKFELWIDTHSSTGNTLHNSGRAVKKSGILLQIEKTAKSNDDDLACFVFILEGAVIYVAISNIRRTLTTE